MNNPPTWLHPAIKEAKKPIEPTERAFGVGIVMVSLVMFIIFSTHLNAKTGFFIRDLTFLEIILFFGYWVAWIITASLDSIFNQRLASRLFDSFGGILFMAISSIYFAVTFPFDFYYFSVVFPEPLQPLLSWVSNELAIGVFVFMGIAMLMATVFSPFAYKLVSLPNLKARQAG